MCTACSVVCWKAVQVGTNTMSNACCNHSILVCNVACAVRQRVSQNCASAYVKYFRSETAVSSLQSLCAWHCGYNCVYAIVITHVAMLIGEKKADKCPRFLCALRSAEAAAMESEACVAAAATACGAAGAAAAGGG
jgi:hypothetical protein